MEFPETDEDDNQSIDTLEAEVDKYIHMRPTEFGLLGQALIIYEKCIDPRTDMSGLNGEWWMGLPEGIRRRMVQGIAAPQMISYNGIETRYLKAREI